MHARQAVRLHCRVFEWKDRKLLGVTAEPTMDPDGGDICYATEIGSNSSRSRDTDRANMELIAEAFNVFVESGMTPAELYKELKEVCWMLDGLNK